MTMACKNRNTSNELNPFLEIMTRPAMITANNATSPKKERIKNRLQ
jgi:hypothetical protein